MTPALFLDAAHDLLVLGNFDDGMRLAISSLGDLQRRVDERSWDFFCRRTRSFHPITELLARSEILRSLRERRAEHGELSAAELWQRALREAPEPEDILGHAIDRFLRTLSLQEPGAWNESAALRGFLDCFVNLEMARAA